MRTVVIRVYGSVQGVFYRKGVQQKAIALGLNGFVRNQPDDSVYIVTTGENQSIEELITWCRQGPPRAVVERLETEEIALAIFRGFTIER